MRNISRGLDYEMAKEGQDATERELAWCKTESESGREHEVWTAVEWS